MITSTQNSKVKEIRQLQTRAKARKKHHAFVVEGVRLCEEALAAGMPVRYGLHAPDLSERGMALVAGLAQRGIAIEAAAEYVIQAVSETKTPQGILLVLEADPLPLPEKPSLVLVLDRISDPGNLGSLLRTAAAAGVEAALLSEGCTDIFSPKVVRAGMGAHFRLPAAVLSDEEIIQVCKRWGVQLWASVMGQGVAHTLAALDQPSALIVGSEADGVSGVLLRAAKPLHIPMPGGSESLNAAAAGAILVYEALRQRDETTQN
ncbi:MAG: RNA methyltransferase [Anaerolineales bacterium]|nr:RNA methyltransferase [Anaerolineales bacterium]